MLPDTAAPTTTVPAATSAAVLPCAPRHCSSEPGLTCTLPAHPANCQVCSKMRIEKRVQTCRMRVEEGGAVADARSCVGMRREPFS